MGSSGIAPSAQHTFISYSRSDEPRALEIAKTLEEAGVPIWIDRTGISGGSEWAAVISGAIRGASRVIVLCSDESLHSRNVRRELQLAWDFDVPILPVLLEPVTFPDGVSYFLQGVHWIELFQTGGLDRLTAALAPDRTPAGSIELQPSRVKLPFRRALIGREESIRQLVDAIVDQRKRLVTIVGPGGIGKTVLATAVGEAVIPTFDDGVVFVDLTAVREPGDVISAIGQALDVGASSSMAQADRLAALLADKRLLVILDNFEQVVDAAGAVATLVAETSELQFLVTSRVPLRVRAETIYAAPTLLDGQEFHAAFELFVLRAKEADPAFEVTDQARPAILEICRRLDGLPLAIELAAARVRLVTPEQMLSRMTRTLPLLTSGARDAPERHRTLTATIDWSYQQLAPAEQRLFRIMGVFSGGCRFDALESVLIELTGSSDDLFAGLDALLEWNLVRRTIGVSGEPRFSLLEMIREFAESQLIESGMAPAAREAHARWCLDFALEAEADLRSTARQAEHFAAIADELGNIRTALRYFEDVRDGSRLIRTIVALEEYLLSHPFDRESFEWLETSFAFDPDLDTETFVLASCIASAVAGRVSKLGSFVDRMPDALRLAEESCSPYLLGRVYFEYGARHGYNKDHPGSLEWYRRAAGVFRQTDYRSYTAMSLGEVAHLMQWLGDPVNAEPIANEALEIMRTTGDDWALGMVLRKRSDLAASLGEFEFAIDLLTEAIEIGQRVGDVRSLLGMAAGAGRIAILMGAICPGLQLLGYHHARRADGYVASDYPDTVMAELTERAATQLGADAVARCWEQGARLSLDDGISSAVALLDRLAGRSSAGQPSENQS